MILPSFESSQLMRIVIRLCNSCYISSPAPKPVSPSLWAPPLSSLAHFWRSCQQVEAESWPVSSCSNFKLGLPDTTGQTTFVYGADFVPPWSANTTLGRGGETIATKYCVTVHSMQKPCRGNTVRQSYCSSLWERATMESKSIMLLGRILLNYHQKQQWEGITLHTTWGW